MYLVDISFDDSLLLLLSNYLKIGKGFIISECNFLRKMCDSLNYKHANKIVFKYGSYE